MPGTPDRRPSPLPAVIGVALTAILLLALGLWTAQRRNDPASFPQLTLLEPARDTTLAFPLTLTFESSLDLSWQPSGWANGRYHVHVLVNDMEVMPAENDIRPTGGRRYDWQLSAVPDSAVLQLVWALPSHQRLAEGASARVQIHRSHP